MEKMRRMKKIEEAKEIEMVKEMKKVMEIQEGKAKEMATKKKEEAGLRRKPERLLLSLHLHPL